MFTQLELKCLDLWFSLISKWVTCPFDYASGRLSLVRSKYKAYLWGGNILVLTVWLIISLVQMRETMRSRRVFPDLVLNSIAILGLLGMVPFELSLWFYKEEFLEFVNGSFSLNRELGERFPDYLGKLDKKIRERIIMVTLVAYASCATTCGIFILATGNFSFSIYYFLRQELQLPFGISLVLFLVLVTIVVTEIIVNAVTQMVGLILLMSSIFWIKRACIDWPQQGVPTRVSLFVYKCCLIHNNIFNAGLGKLFVPSAKMILIYTFLVCSFGLICFKDQLDWMTVGTVLVLGTTDLLIALVPGALLMSATYNYSSKLHQYVMPAIRRLENCKERRILEKELIACNVIRCNVGNFYYMESKAKMTLAQNVVNYLVFLVIQNQTRVG